MKADVKSIVQKGPFLKERKSLINALKNRGPQLLYSKPQAIQAVQI